MHVHVLAIAAQASFDHDHFRTGTLSPDNFVLSSCFETWLTYTGKKRKLPRDLKDASTMAINYLTATKKISDACQVLRSLSSLVPRLFLSHAEKESGEMRMQFWFRVECP